MATLITSNRSIVPGSRYNVATAYTQATRFYLFRSSSDSIEATDWTVIRTVLVDTAVPVTQEWIINSIPVYGKAATWVLSGTTTNPQKFYLYFPRRTILGGGTFTIYSNP